MFGQGRIKTWHEQALFDVTLFPNNTDNNDTSWTRKDDTMFAVADPVISFNQFSHSINASNLRRLLETHNGEKPNKWCPSLCYISTNTDMQRSIHSSQNTDQNLHEYTSKCQSVKM